MEPSWPLSADSYTRLRLKLIFYFEGRGCPCADDLADETVRRLLMSLGHKNPDNLNAWAYGIARRVLLEWVRKEGKFTSLEGTDFAVHTDAAAEDSRRRAHEALLALEPCERELLEEYYLENEDAATLGKKWKLSAAGLRTKIHRLKRRLAALLESENVAAETNTRNSDTQ